MDIMSPETAAIIAILIAAGSEIIKAGLAESIAIQANPPIVYPGLPWAS